MRQQVWRPPRSSQPAYLRSLTTDASANGKLAKWHVLQRPSICIAANEASVSRNCPAYNQPGLEAHRRQDSECLTLSEQDNLGTHSGSHRTDSPDVFQTAFNHLHSSVKFSDASCAIENTQTLASDSLPLDHDHSCGKDILICKSELVQGTSFDLLQARLPNSNSDTTVLLTFLRDTLSEVAHLETRTPSTIDGEVAKDNIFASDFHRLVGQLEEAVLDFVMVDTVAELTRIGIANTTLTDSLSEQISTGTSVTASIFLTQCVNFELNLQKRYSRSSEL